MSTEIPTPRTDALIRSPHGNYFSASAEDFRNLARALERELHVAEEALRLIKHRPKAYTAVAAISETAIARLREMRKEVG